MLAELVRRAPSVVGAWTLGTLCTALAILNTCGELDLERSPGFAEAVASLTNDAPEIVVIWPPHAQGLYALPPSLLATDSVPADPPDRRLYRRLAVLGPAGFSDPPELAASDREPRERFGALEVARYRYAATDRVLYSLRRSLDRVSVSLRGPQHQVTCDQPRPGGGWLCPGRPQWNHVGPRRLRVEGQEWPSVWVHPVTDHVVELDLGELELGNAVLLEGALDDGAAVTRGGTPVEVTLDIERTDGRPNVTRKLRRNNPAGIASERVELTPGRGRIRLQVRSARDARRHFALNLQILDVADDS